MADPRIPADDQGEVRRIIQQIFERLRELEKPTGTQLSRIVDEVRSLVADLDERVQEYITLYSMTRAEIISLSWLGLLPPAKGGTGTSSVYNNGFTVGSWRAAYALEATSELGYPPSLRELKQDIGDAVIDVAAWLSLPVQRFRYRADVEANGDEAQYRLGFIAEDLQAAGLDDWLYKSEDGALQGVAYEHHSLALHEIVRAQQDQIEALVARVAVLEGNNHDVE